MWGRRYAEALHAYHINLYRVSYNKNVIITIDGAAGSGKTTTAKYFAKHYWLTTEKEKITFCYMSSGLFYRTITLELLYSLYKKSASMDVISFEKFIDTINIEKLMKYTKLEYKRMSDMLVWEKHSLISALFEDRGVVTHHLYSQKVSEYSAHVSCYIPLRKALTRKMQEILSTGHWIVEGRDAGSHIAANAILKVYLVADNSVRAKRRYKQRHKTSAQKNCKELQHIQQDLKQRDAIDMNKGEYSLVMHKDAVLIDSAKNSIAQICKKIYNKLLDRIKNYQSN